MKINAYSVYDVAVGAYQHVWFARSDQEAIRGFTNIATNAESDVGKHPEDYTLFAVGTWEDQKGALTGEEPRSLATALEVISAQQKVNGAQLDAFDKTLAPGGTA